MGKGRFEAFSDGVMAIIITIMVLELKVPHGADVDALRPLLPVFLSYLLSFAYLGIYWNNHHHMLHATQRVTGGMLWANLHLLFWLSLVPLTTDWMGETHAAAVPTAAYGCVLLLAGLAFLMLEKAIIRSQGADSRLAKAIGNHAKETISVVAYALAIGAAFVQSLVSIALYVFVAVLWLVPDRRMARQVHG